MFQHLESTSLTEGQEKEGQETSRGMQYYNLKNSSGGGGGGGNMSIIRHSQEKRKEKIKCINCFCA